MRVRWTQPSIDDFTHICDHTEDRFGAARARNTALAIYESVDSLRTMPNKGRPGRRPKTRELDIQRLPFVAIYRVRASVIEIIRVLHAAQKWP
jgi:toxin ParE1/3/4